jgi:hypothetical protein
LARTTIAAVNQLRMADITYIRLRVEFRLPGGGVRPLRRRIAA